MITDIKKLKKIDDILNSEGTILGLYKLDTTFYLASYLVDGTGMVYYSTTKDNLLQYLKGNTTLRKVYLDSDDFIVSKKFRNDTVTFLKQDFANKLQCGDEYYDKLSDGLKNPNIERQINGS